MTDEMERLRECAGLFTLLEHYAERAVPDKQAWQDRVMQRESEATSELTHLHGELLAYGWVEQNTGSVPVLCQGEVKGCYRVTREGLRALKQVTAGDEE